MADKRVIVVTGPTASGKSALALALAEKRGGPSGATVINADAMQTYDAFPILTAQPTLKERARVPHALYGNLPLSETLNAARWARLATDEIERSRVPILCGGSGLYLRTLMQGISAVPDVPAGVREQANAEWQTLGPDGFRARLAQHDPEIVARLKTGDRQRHVRAWEVLQATGRPLSAWQKGAGTPAPWRFATILLAPDRAWLRQRIETRFDAMLTAGVMAEVRGVFDAEPDPVWPGLKAHGAPELFAHFRGEMRLEDARRIAIDHTRQYAKRQMTWFRGQLTPDLVIDPSSNPDLGTIEKFLDNFDR